MKRSFAWRIAHSSHRNPLRYDDVHSANCAEAGQADIAPEDHRLTRCYCICRRDRKPSGAGRWCCSVDQRAHCVCKARYGTGVYREGYLLPVSLGQCAKPRRSTMCKVEWRPAAFDPTVEMPLSVPVKGSSDAERHTALLLLKRKLVFPPEEANEPTEKGDISGESTPIHKSKVWQPNTF